MYQDLKKYCLYCEEEFPIFSRIDKKFCGNRCKNAYHNNIQRHKRHIRKAVDSALHRNHDLLERHLSSSSISLLQLEKQGFQPEIFNSLTQDENRKIWRVCYNFEFTQYDSEGVIFIKIRKKYE